MRAFSSGLCSGIPCPETGFPSAAWGQPWLGIVIGALICHFLFYLVPGNLGMSTGLPLYVVGSSIFGAAGA